MNIVERYTFIIAITIVLIAGASITGAHTVIAKSKDSKAKDAIIKAIGKSVEGKYASIKLVAISKSNVSGFVIAYNTTKPGPGPVIPPEPPQPPVPTPTGNISTVCLVGDLSGSTVPNMMKSCDTKIGIGDLGYASTLAWFKSINFDKCVLGNHEATEDGSSSLQKETLAYCGDHWSLVVANGTALVIGLNTNGDAAAQLNFVKSLPLINYKTVVIVSHKGGNVPPNSHHGAEAKTLYQQISTVVPAGIKLIQVFGHNHVMSSAPSINTYQSGAGGKSHYDCGTNTVWTFCDNKSWGYLEITIDNSNGNAAARFVK